MNLSDWNQPEFSIKSGSVEDIGKTLFCSNAEAIFSSFFRLSLEADSKGCPAVSSLHFYLKPVANSKRCDYLYSIAILVHGLGGSTVDPPPSTINFMVIYRYLYTSHYRINLSPRNIQGFFFSISLYLYPTGSNSQDFCDSFVWASKPSWDSTYKQTKQIQVSSCSPMSQLSFQPLSLFQCIYKF